MKKFVLKWWETVKQELQGAPLAVKVTQSTVTTVTVFWPLKESSYTKKVSDRETPHLQ